MCNEFRILYLAESARIEKIADSEKQESEYMKLVDLYLQSIPLPNVNDLCFLN